MGHTYFLIAAWFNLSPPLEATLVGDLKSGDMKELLQIVNNAFRPEFLLTVKVPGVEGEKLSDIVPFTRDRKTIDGRATAYVCSNFTCHQPVTGPKQLRQMIN